MAALPIIANTLRVTLDWQNLDVGHDAHNVLHFVGDPGDEEELATAIADNLNINQFSCVSENTTLKNIDVIALDGGSATAHFPQDNSMHGGSGTSPVPAACAVISLATGTRGPSGRGRIYLPYVGEDGMSDGRVIPASVTAMNAQWEGFRDDMVAAGHAMLVASYKDSVSRQVLSLITRTLLGTQRRRQDALR